MAEIKDYNPYKEEPKVIDKVNALYDAWMDSNKKEIKIPRKAKVKKRKMKQGYFGVIYINENGNIWGEKAKVEDFVFREKNSIRYHSTDGREILFWMGKFPVILQPTWKKNPINLRINEEEKNEVYGQKYIMARMLADVIKVKSKGGAVLLWILGAGVAGYIIYSIFTGGA